MNKIYKLTNSIWSLKSFQPKERKTKPKLKGHRQLIFERLRYIWHLWCDIRVSNRHVPIALGNFSNLEHYFTFPALLSTFLTLEQNWSIFSLFGQHLSTYFYNFPLVNAIFCLRKVFRKPSNSIIMNLNKSTLSPDMLSWKCKSPIRKSRVKALIDKTKNIYKHLLGNN